MFLERNQRGSDATKLAMLMGLYLVSNGEVEEMSWDNLDLEENGMLPPRKLIPCQNWPIPSHGQ